MDRIVLQHNSREVAEALRLRADKALPALDRALGRGAHEVARDAQQEMPKFRSDTVRATGVEHVGPLRWHVTFGTEHAAFTERGTGPGGAPSLAETLDWIRLKGIQPRDPSMDAAGLAFVIRRKIAREGVPAQPFAEPALLRNRPRLVELLDNAARAVMAAP